MKIDSSLSFSCGAPTAATAALPLSRSAPASLNRSAMYSLAALNQTLLSHWLNEARLSHLIGLIK